MSKSKYSDKLNNILTKEIFERAKKENKDSADCYDLVYCILSDNKNNINNILSYLDVSVPEMMEDIFKGSEISHEECHKDDEKNIEEESCVIAKRVSSLLRSASRIAAKNLDNEIQCEHVIAAILKYRGDGENVLFIKNIFSKYGVNYSDFWDVFRMSIEEKNNKKIQKISKNEKITENVSPEEKISKILEELVSNGQIQDMNKYVKENYMEFVGREKEIERCIRILCRKQKNNLLIIGESGTGKTSLVCNLIQKIMRENVPDKIKNKKFLQIFMDSMIAGTKYRGQFEERMKNIFKVIKIYNKEFGDQPIMFFDEIHNIIGAGSAEGSMDAVGMMKPKLSNGEIQCIGTTTISEYRKYISKDPALSRRFSVIFLEEPKEAEAVKIINGIKHLYEDHHKVIISDEIVEEAVSLGEKYIKDRFFPDKAIDILDEACSKTVNIHNNKDIYHEVEKETIYEIVSEMTNMPLHLVSSKEKKILKNLPERVKESVYGQDDIVDNITTAIISGRSGFRDPEKPIGTFMFIGTTGVGKTVLAKEISKELFGTERIIRLDMSEYMEKHSISKIIGSPPGYVGYDDDGTLAEKVKKQPYSVVLLDEIEKAHSDITNIFLQVFDEGRLTDSTGRFIDFRNTIIIMTSNLSASKIGKFKKLGFHATADTMEDKKEIEKFLNKEVKEYFPPELVNRIDEILVFNKLNKETVNKILDNEFKKIIKRLEEKEITLQLSDKAKEFLSKKGFDPDYGARPMKRALQKYVENPLAKMYVSDELKRGCCVSIDHDNDQPDELKFTIK